MFFCSNACDFSLEGINEDLSISRRRLVMDYRLVLLKLAIVDLGGRDSWVFISSNS
jgi:hypothetical protein